MSTIHAGELPGQRAAADTRPHPLEPLTEDEVRATASLVRRRPEFVAGSTFVSIRLREPAKEALNEAESSGRHLPRESAVVLYDRSRRQVIEVAVGLTTGVVTEWRVVPERVPKRPAVTSRRPWLR